MISEKVPRERNRFLSRPDVRVYLQKYPDATTQEKRDLVRWLKAGQSPATNDCNLCDDRGYPLDFIEARRTEQDLIQQHLLCPVKVENLRTESMDDSEKLPF